MLFARRMRGILRTAATWSALFGVAGLILIAVDRLVTIPPVADAQLLLSRYVIGGALAGTLFATTLILAERGARTLHSRRGTCRLGLRCRSCDLALLEYLEGSAAHFRQVLPRLDGPAHHSPWQVSGA